MHSRALLQSTPAVQRVGLEDIYRGTAMLESQERVDLAALLATTNKKVRACALAHLDDQPEAFSLLGSGCCQPPRQWMQPPRELMLLEALVWCAARR